ncbi:MAG: family 10 glycosylhydrolase [Rhodothermaceae bacterium]|nr:family 10 glycosylhydrolase [Rhodothermaceae bacterium]
MRRVYREQVWRSTLFMVVVFLAVMPLRAQENPLPKYEFRGAWMASVLNLDWPDQNASAASQEATLTEMLDALQDAGINALIFQVRAESDALYLPGLEPWSFWLTGEQGAAPDPFIDPLDLIIEEAHRRGMELHAWFNPYRAIRGSGYTNSPDHITQTQPDWTLAFGNLVLLDPGLQEVRDHVTKVIMDVARRYDIDGVHFDDFFYPYPPNTITIEDINTFNAFNRGFTNMGDWRRDNVNLLIEQVSDSLQAIKPYLKFGISPFGIWRNGVPSGIVGLDAANVIYGDALAWLDAQTIDYIAPQLYWAFGGAQDYGKLAPWWASQTNGRHLYTGHGLYRSDPNTFASTLYSESEVPNQVRFNRRHEAIQGSVFFRSKNITDFLSKGFADSLETDLFRFPALTPPMDWKDMQAPDPPVNLQFAWTATDEITLNWESTEDLNQSKYAVYRVLTEDFGDPSDFMNDPQHMLAVTGDTFYVDKPGIAQAPYYYFVTSVSRNSIESSPSNIIDVQGRAVAVEQEVPAFAELYQNFPNPFSSSTEIRFHLQKPALLSLFVHNVLGQRVATLMDNQSASSGLQTVSWDGEDESGKRLSSGTYYYVLTAGEYYAIKGMVLLR